MRLGTRLVALGNILDMEFPDCAPIRAKFFRDDPVIVELRGSLSRGLSMLVARRDPPFHVEADRDDLHTNSGIYPVRKTSGLTRFVTAIQMVGSLLAVPVGIASGYSFYRSNFSPEITCQGLRSGIVAMLDKNVDAATQRILVRRDVEAFEKTCGSVDPDATAAFKTLLSVGKTAAPASTPPAAKAQRVDTVSKEPVRKAEPRSQAPVKQPATAVTSVTAEPVRRDPDISDAQWLDAVRQALLTHKEDVSVPGLQGAKPQPAPIAVARPTPRDPALAQPPTPAPTPIVTPSAAPTLPPAISVAPSPGSVKVTDDHPVPPGSIPDSVPPANADIAKPDEHSRSRIGKWISAIPLLGPVVDNARH